MMPTDPQQRIQEIRYQFPYHYIPNYDDGDFIQARALTWGYEYLAYIRFVIEKVRSLSFGSLLDAGCGDGRFLYELRRVCPDKELVGIDSSEQAIRYARALSPNVEYICGDIGNPVALRRQFDIVTLIEVLEHVPPDGVREFVEGLQTRVKTNGILLATVPSQHVKVARKHYRHFDLELLREALQPYFAISEHCFINRISWRAKWMERLLVNRWFILNHRRLLNWLYRSYEKHLLTAEENNAKRICAVCRKGGTA
jgi:SAM-dependent methyltransferase